MQLEDRLRICLLAVESRYPDHVVDWNEEVLGPQSQDAEGWSALELLDHLEKTAPDLLEKPARLVIDTQKSEMYLIEHNELIPALFVHCRGRLPLRKVHTFSQSFSQA